MQRCTRKNPERKEDNEENKVEICHPAKLIYILRNSKRSISDFLI